MAEATIGRLEKLASMLDKNRWAYYGAIESGRDVSSRMCGWIDEYDDARGGAAWREYCERHGLALGHRAMDVLA